MQIQSLKINASSLNSKKNWKVASSKVNGYESGIMTK